MPLQTPKQKFLANKDAVAKLQRIVDDPFVEDALAVALLEYVESLSDSNDPVALPNYYRIQGAKAFRRLFLRLTDVPEKADTRQRDVLNPSAETYIAPPRSK